MIIYSIHWGTKVRDHQENTCVPINNPVELKQITISPSVSLSSVIKPKMMILCTREKKRTRTPVCEVHHLVSRRWSCVCASCEHHQIKYRSSEKPKICIRSGVLTNIHFHDIIIFNIKGAHNPFYFHYETLYITKKRLVFILLIDYEDNFSLK